MSDTIGVVLTVLCGLIALVWSARHLKINRAKRENLVLTPHSPGADDRVPRISVLVAAKDEEDNIAACVETMLSQDYPDFEVLVMNDRSADRTAEIVQTIAERDPRLRLINIDHLPDGWCGKNHAMAHGVRESTGEYLCMIDADCRQLSPRTLTTAMRHALDKQVDLLSVLPTLEMKGAWENIIQPVCSGIMIIWFQPEQVNSDRYPQAYANGAFMLFRREAYEKVGGHEAVRTAMLEDMQFALRVKESGLRLNVIQNEGLYIVRMYTSLKAILNGWCRIFFCTFGTKRRLRISMLILVFMGLLPYLTAVLGWALWAGGAGVAWLAAGIAGTAAAVMQVSVINRFYRLIHAQPWLCWTYPLGAFMALIALAKAYGKHRSGAQVTWRNTTYNVGAKS